MLSYVFSVLMSLNLQSTNQKSAFFPASLAIGLKILIYIKYKVPKGTKQPKKAKENAMNTSDYVIKVVVEYTNMRRLIIDDPYMLDQLAGLLSPVSKDEIEEVINMLNEEDRGITI